MADTPADPAVSELSSSNESKIRSTKRKLDDAFQVLDNAVTATVPTERPSPPKRANMIRSLYSTLTKYGIKSGTNPVARASTPLSILNTKSTPHLTAILNRAASKTKSTFSFNFSSRQQTPAPPLPITAEYRPSSLPSFLSRLATYKLTTYANKPPAIDAVAASKCGWINDGKDRLVCGLCNASWVVAGRDGMNRETGNTLIEKQRMALVEAHKNGCPWKMRQCEDSIYCVPLQSPTAMINDMEVKAADMDPLIKDISIKHPLTASQLSSLRETLSLHAPQQSRNTASRMDEDHADGSSTSPPPRTSPPPPPARPSETAVLISLFGWSLVPPAAPETSRRVSSSRITAPSSPALSRASSVSLPPTPSKSSQSKNTPELISTRFASGFTLSKPENALLQCELCQRRLGVWAFNARPATECPETPEKETSTTTTDNSAPASARPRKPLPRRSFDLLKEHRSYCPYVVRSTRIPSLPVPPSTSASALAKSSSSNGHALNSSISHVNGQSGPPGAIEGWKAALMVVLRFGMVQKQRVEYNFLAHNDTTPETAEGGDQMEVDSVKAMVTGVKTRGGKDLLKYVRGLLG